MRLSILGVDKSILLLIGKLIPTHQPVASSLAVWKELFPLPSNVWNRLIGEHMLHSRKNGVLWRVIWVLFARYFQNGGQGLVIWVNRVPDHICNLNGDESKKAKVLIHKTRAVPQAEQRSVAEKTYVLTNEQNSDVISGGKIFESLLYRANWGLWTMKEGRAEKVKNNRDYKRVWSRSTYWSRRQESSCVYERLRGPHQPEESPSQYPANRELHYSSTN